MCIAHKRLKQLRQLQWDAYWERIKSFIPNHLKGANSAPADPLAELGKEVRKIMKRVKEKKNRRDEEEREKGATRGKLLSDAERVWTPLVPRVTRALVRLLFCVTST